MKAMLNGLSITLDGNHHSGIDDVKNIAKILKTMIKEGATFDVTAIRDADTKKIKYISPQIDDEEDDNNNDNRKEEQ